MNRDYHVLWFDDESDTLEAIVDKALEKNIILKGVKNADEGLEYLMKNSNSLDAVLLDGKFYDNATDQANQVLSEKAFGRVAFYMKQLADNGDYLPWFILSGQPSFAKEKNPLVEVLGESAFGDGKVFDKNLDEEEELFNQMIKSIEESEKFQIKQKYKSIFDLIQENYLGPSEENRITDIIGHLEVYDPTYPTRELFTPLRKVLERMMDRLKEMGCIAEDVTSLNASSKFLCSKEFGYQYHFDIVNPVIDYLLQTSLHIINDATHNRDGLQLNVDVHLSDSNKSYLYRSTAYQLFEILEWFKKFIDSNQDVDKNRSRWERSILDSNSIIGTIQQDENGNYHVNEYLLSYREVESEFTIGQTIEITQSADNSNPRTKNLYPKYARAFRAND